MPYISKLKQNELANFFSSFLGSFAFYRNQGEYVYDCPECGKRKFCVNFGKGVAHCWKCYDMSYGKLRFFIKQRYPEYLEEYNEIVKDEEGSAYALEEEHEEEQDVVQEIALPDAFESLSNSFVSRPFVNYLAGRKVSLQIILKYGIGCCPSGRFYDRVVIPSYSRGGKANFFVGRAIFKGQDPPYLNSIAEKTKIIFAENLLDMRNKPLIITEGIFDAFAIEDAVGDDAFGYTILMGKTLHQDDYLFQKIVESKTDVYLALDNDARSDAIRIAKTLDFWDVDTYLCFPPVGFKDFGEIGQHEKRDEIVNKVLKSAPRYDTMMDMLSESGRYFA